MLVKELRQGMRSRVFIISFMALQVAMIFPALFGLLDAAAGDSIDGVTVFFWLIVGVPLVLVMPGAALGAISREKLDNTLEPIFLTPLTARRIVFGKWVATVAQTLLLVAAILPYAVLRYYLGGVDIDSELTSLAAMVAGSAVLSGIAVGISPVMGRLGRILLAPVVVIVGLYTLVWTIAATMNPVLSGGGLTWDGWKVGALTLQGFYLLLLMLEVGAGKIGPAAENHSTSKRLIALASTVTAVAFSYAPRAQWWMWLAPLVVVGPVLIGAICEPIREVPTVYRPFVRKGFAGRAFGRLFYPGWPSGFFFAVLVLAIAGWRLDQMALGRPYPSHGAHWRLLSGPLRHTVSHFAGLSPTDEIMVRVAEVAAVGALLMPAALFRLLPARRLGFPMIFYFGFQVVLSLVSVIGVMATEFQPHNGYHPGPSGLEQVINGIPTCALIEYSRIYGWAYDQQCMVLGWTSFFAIVSILTLLVLQRPAWRAIATLEKTAAGLEPAAAAPPDARPVAAA
jgi:hypothetical protein